MSYILVKDDHNLKNRNIQYNLHGGLGEEEEKVSAIPNVIVNKDNFGNVSSELLFNFLQNLKPGHYDKLGNEEKQIYIIKIHDLFDIDENRNKKYFLSEYLKFNPKVKNDYNPRWIFDGEEYGDPLNPQFMTLVMIPEGTDVQPNIACCNLDLLKTSKDLFEKEETGGFSINGNFFIFENHVNQYNYYGLQKFKDVINKPIGPSSKNLDRYGNNIGNILDLGLREPLEGVNMTDNEKDKGFLGWIPDYMGVVLLKNVDNKLRAKMYNYGEYQKLETTFNELIKDQDRDKVLRELSTPYNEKEIEDLRFFADSFKVTGNYLINNGEILYSEKIQEYYILIDGYDEHSLVYKDDEFPIMLEIPKYSLIKTSEIKFDEQLVFYSNIHEPNVMMYKTKEEIILANENNILDNKNLSNIVIPNDVNVILSNDKNKLFCPKLILNFKENYEHLVDSITLLKFVINGQNNEIPTTKLEKTVKNNQIIIYGFWMEIINTNPDIINKLIPGNKGLLLNEDMPAKIKATNLIIKAGSFMKLNDKEMYEIQVRIKLPLDLEKFFPFSLQQVYSLMMPPGMPQHADDINPRSVLFIDNIGNIFFLNIEGRFHTGRGLDLFDVSELVQKMGAQYAINLDGGGSSNLYWKIKNTKYDDYVGMNNYKNIEFRQEYSIGNMISFFV